mgnify:CR=1 FL=1
MVKTASRMLLRMALCFYAGQECWGQMTATDLTIASYTLVSTRRITAILFDYTYRLTATNVLALPRIDVRGTLASKSPNIQVIDGNVSLGNIAPYAVVPSVDTFTFVRIAGFRSILPIYCGLSPKCLPLTAERLF